MQWTTPALALVLLAPLAGATPAAGLLAKDACGPSVLTSVCVEEVADAQLGCTQGGSGLRVTCAPTGALGARAVARERDAAGLAAVCAPGTLEVAIEVELAWTIRWTDGASRAASGSTTATREGAAGWSGLDDCATTVAWSDTLDPIGFAAPCGGCTLDRVDVTLAWTIDAAARAIPGVEPAHATLVASGARTCTFVAGTPAQCA